jgi:hypothetical protein
MSDNFVALFTALPHHQTWYKIKIKQCLSIQNFTSLFYRLTYQLNGATRWSIKNNKICEDEIKHFQWGFIRFLRP